MKPEARLQIGKNGLTEGTFEILNNLFKKHDHIKISLLKSTGHDRDTTKDIAEKIVEKLGKNFTYRILGFTINLRKWKKLQR